ncbi:MAG: TfoX/Sxy family protein [Gammaproteobacteria bacterium]
MSEYIDHLHEVFERFGPIQARRMFAGHGLFHDGLMFALVADDCLYLKADAEIAHRFEAAGLKQFEYEKADRMVKMSYYLAPDDLFDDVDEAAIWARHSFEAALRSQPKPKHKR